MKNIIKICGFALLLSSITDCSADQLDLDIPAQVHVAQLISEQQEIYRANNQKYVIGSFGLGGMGICLNSVLNHLLYCESHNLIPVVYWYRSAYHNGDGFNGKSNDWEYYFNQVSHLQYATGDKINKFCGEKDGCGHFSYYDTSPEKRNLAYRLFNTYIHLNPIVQRKVDQFYNTYLAGKKTIAIHIRGTDKYTEEKPVSPQRMITEALKYADNETQFFIATDEQQILNEMINLLQGRKVVYYNCYRSENGKPLHVRKKPSFSQVGEDITVEMWLMAKCDMFFHTLSNVSSIPLYLNPTMPHVTVKG